MENIEKEFEDLFKSAWLDALLWNATEEMNRKTKETKTMETVVLELGDCFERAWSDALLSDTTEDNVIRRDPWPLLKMAA